MGAEDLYRFSHKDQTVRACADMLIVASEAELSRIEVEGDQAGLPGLMTFPSGPADRVPDELLARAQVVVVEIDPVSSRSLDRLRQVTSDWPDLPVIAAISNATVALTRTLVREGISDVVTLPFQLDELLDVALSARRAARSRREQAIKLAPQIAVVRSVGGCGATSFATHLAGAFGQRSGSAKPVAMIDFDLQSGVAAEYLGAGGMSSLTDLMVAGDRLDADLLRSAARGIDGNVEVFAAPIEIQPIESIDTDRALEVLIQIRQNHSAAVIDLPVDWTNWALSVVLASDLIVMVVELSVNSLRQAKRQLDLFANVGIEHDKIVLVVNRVERRMFRSVDLSDVTSTLKHEVIGTLTLENDLAAAQAQGRLVYEVVRKSRYGADVAEIAEHISARLDVGGE